MFLALLPAAIAKAPWPAIEVERPLVLGAGWLEIEVRADLKRATGTYAGDGAVEPLPAGVGWLYTTEQIGLRYGFLPNAEIYAEVPFAYAVLTEGADRTSEFGLADLRVGSRVQWFRRHSPGASVASDLCITVPAGGEDGGSVGLPRDATAVPLAVGVAGATLELLARRQFGPTSVTGAVGYTHFFEGQTAYRVASSQAFKPGDQTGLRLQPLLQLGPVALFGELDLRVRYAAATRGSPDTGLTPLSGSDGWWATLSPGLQVDLSRGLDLRAAVSLPIAGEDAEFFPIETLTPTRGPGWTAAIRGRL